MQYPKVPGEATRLPYYVDVALDAAGYDVGLTLNPAAVKVVWDDAHTLLFLEGVEDLVVGESAVSAFRASRRGERCLSRH
ncbi:hypothetical protein ACFV8Z_51745 [Streptomyces sp. NPDC059837]|uniref:hypothetical protein n=1 Tax=unclassified Streptomyces TaxID=2593676 RepID=UPI002255CF44|nr:hypothetical protein [Streptomyces sp. NBC_00268]MCX5181129.1 hypothetical protein [Streptomyces sp. NBC_00268]MCX5191059.1 hypothetical protein [Streptomyces sp. NBC_00268]